MLDKCEIKVPKSLNYLTEWPFVPWPYVRVAFSPDPDRHRAYSVSVFRYRSPRSAA